MNLHPTSKRNLCFNSCSLDSVPGRTNHFEVPYVRIWRKTGLHLVTAAPPLSQEILALLKRCPSARKVREKTVYPPGEGGD